MRAVLTLAVTCAVLVASASAAAGPSGGTSLRISFWADGTGARPDSVWTLRCDPAGGSLARPSRACDRLEAGGVRLFAPLPKNIVCTEIYGGPQRARIVGTVEDKSVWVTFTARTGATSTAGSGFHRGCCLRAARPRGFICVLREGVGMRRGGRGGGGGGRGGGGMGGGGAGPPCVRLPISSLYSRLASPAWRRFSSWARDATSGVPSSRHALGLARRRGRPQRGRART